MVAMATSLAHLDPHLTHDSLGPSEPTTQTTSGSVQRFCTDDRSVLALYSGTPTPPVKMPLPMGHLGPYLIHGSLGPTKSLTQTASRSVQPLLRVH